MDMFSKLFISITFLLSLSACSDSSNTQIATEKESDGIFNEQTLNKIIFNSSTSNEKGSAYQKATINSQFKRRPTGAQSGVDHSDCHSENLRKKLESSDNFLEDVQAYFNKCGDELSRSQSSGLFAIAQLATVQYDVLKRDNVKPIEITISNGSKIFGFIGIKDQTPRPMVIVKCGVYCSGTPSASTRMMFMHLFDESPYNVLVLGSNSGVDSMRANGQLGLGGFIEGQELIEVGNWLKTHSKYSKYISSLHLTGMSLGGHSALYASLFNKYTPTFNSVISYCPAINLQQSINDLFHTNFLKRLLFNFMTRSVAKQTYSFVPDFKDIFSIDKLPRYKQWPEIFAKAALSRHKKINKDLFLPPYRGTQLNQTSDYWEVNNAIASLPAHSQTPTLVWSSKDDWVISYKNNMKVLKETMPAQHLSLLSTQKGGHCAQSVSYGWPAVGTILRSFIYKHSPELINKRQTKTVKYVWPSPRSYSFHSHQTWHSYKNSKYVYLKYYYNNDCNEWDEYSSPHQCHETKTVRIARKDLPFKKHIIQPKNWAEAEAQTRWLNTNVKIMGYNGLLANSNETARFIQWDALNK